LPRYLEILFGFQVIFS